MYSLCRAINQTHALRSASIISSARNVSIKVVPASSGSNETHDEKNARLQRALSPHLSIYKPQLTTILSISHRFTGMALAGYATVLGLGALVSPVDFSHYVTMVEGLQLSAGTLIALKFVLAYPLGFHAANGVRHLLWDTGKLLKISEVYSSGYAMVGASVILAGILAIL